jgi:hypothetical protein
MSFNNNVRDRKPFCKVCKDAGKPESFYTSHYINDVPGKAGKVVCPTLLAQSCGYCKKERAGHTSRYCPELERKQLRNEQPQREQPLATAPAPKNRYAALMAEMDNEEAVVEAAAVAKEAAAVAKEAAIKAAANEEHQYAYKFPNLLPTKIKQKMPEPMNFKAAVMVVVKPPVPVPAIVLKPAEADDYSRPIGPAGSSWFD